MYSRDYQNPLQSLQSDKHRFLQNNLDTCLVPFICEEIETEK